jgi:hypothetical protein
MQKKTMPDNTSFTVIVENNGSAKIAITNTMATIRKHARIILSLFIILHLVKMGIPAR